MFTQKYCALGVIPYLFIFIYYYYYNLYFTNLLILYSPLIIFVNGILYHYFYTNNIYIKYYDILCNLFLSIYLNIITIYQPYCIFSTLFIYFIFILNKLYFDNDNFIHIFIIQLIGTQFYWEYL